MAGRAARSALACWPHHPCAPKWWEALEHWPRHAMLHPSVQQAALGTLAWPGLAPPGDQEDWAGRPPSMFQWQDYSFVQSKKLPRDGTVYDVSTTTWAKENTFPFLFLHWHRPLLFIQPPPPLRLWGTARRLPLRPRPLPSMSMKGYHSSRMHNVGNHCIRETRSTWDDRTG